MGWTWQNARHAAGLARQGANPAAVVYESTGADFFLAPGSGPSPGCCCGRSGLLWQRQVIDYVLPPAVRPLPAER
jgi:hypothetical protein